jgi:hypothetical protein
VITAAVAQKLKPQSKRVEVHDANGLYLVIQPSGKKSWAYRYRVDGKSRKLTLGSYPAIGLAEARQKAAEAAVKVQRGNDPIVARKRQTGSILNAVLDEFIQQAAQRHQCCASARQARSAAPRKQVDI